MTSGGRRKSIAFFIVLGVCLSAGALALNIGWVIVNWRQAGMLILGVLAFPLIISGVVLNTIFLVREIRRNEQHHAFINAVTHELKTPVASIRLYLETLQTRGVDDSKRNEFYRIMLDDSDRLLGSIDQILRTGRVGPSHRKLNISPIDVRVIIEDCLARIRSLYKVPMEAVRYQPGPPITIQGDVDEVRAAISNLIDNAVKYSGKEVNVSVEAAKIDGKYVSVRVKDHGVGIPNSELKQVFKRFYRAPGPHARRVPGTGLGLFIVRSVARAHGGRVWAESDGPGRGSTFVLQLPINQ